MGTGGGALRRLYAVNGTLKPGERVACAGARAGIVASSFGAWTGTGKPAHGWTLVGGVAFVVMKTWTERRLLALKHVISGRRIIDRQRRAIAQRKAIGADTSESERLLESFEKTQLIFEQDLADLDRRKS